MPSAALATTGTTLTATEYNYLPRGLLARVSSTSSFRTTGTHTTYQDEGLSVSTTYLGSRFLRVTWTGHLYVSGGTNTINLKIIRGSTDLNEFTVPAETLATGFGHAFTFSYTFAGPASGATETFKVQIRASTNNTAVDSYAAAASIRVLTIEDLGSQ